MSQQSNPHQKLIRANIIPAQVDYLFANINQQLNPTKYKGIILMNCYVGHQIPHKQNQTLSSVSVKTKSGNSIAADKNLMMNLDQCGFIYLGANQVNQKYDYVFIAHFDEIADSTERSDYICNIRENLQLTIVPVKLQQQQNGDIIYVANGDTSCGSSILSIIRDKIYLIGIHTIQNQHGRHGFKYKLRYFEKMPCSQRTNVYQLLVMFSDCNQKNKVHFEQFCRKHHKQSQYISSIIFSSLKKSSEATQYSQRVQSIERSILKRKRPNKIFTALSSHLSNIRYQPSTNNQRKLKKDFQYIYRKELVYQFILQLYQILENLNQFMKRGQLLKQINLLDLNIDINSAGNVKVILHISNHDFISLGQLVQHFLQKDKGIEYIHCAFKCKYDIHEASSEYQERLNQLHQQYDPKGSDRAKIQIQNKCLEIVEIISKNYLSTIVDHILHQYLNAITNMNQQLKLPPQISVKESNLNHFIRMQCKENSKYVSTYEHGLHYFVKPNTAIYTEGMALSASLKGEFVKLMQEKNNALHQMLSYSNFQHVVKHLYAKFPKIIRFMGKPIVDNLPQKSRQFVKFLIDVTNQLTKAKLFQNDFRLPNIIKLNDSYKLIDFDMAFFFDGKSQVAGAKEAYLKTISLVVFYINQIKKEKRSIVSSSTNSQCMSSNLFYKDMSQDEQKIIQQLLQQKITRDHQVQWEMKKLQAYMHYYNRKNIFKMINQGRSDNSPNKSKMDKKLSWDGDEIKGFEYNVDDIMNSSIYFNSQNSMQSINISQSLQEFKS